MYWHIDTDIIGLLVICALYYYSVKLLPTDAFTSQNKSFMRCMKCGFVMTAIDIAASVVMEVPTTRFIYQALMSMYMLVLELVIVSWFLYSLTILYHDDEGRRKRASVYVVAPYALYALLVLSNPWTELLYSLGPKLEYARSVLFLPVGIGLYSAYAVALTVLILLRRKYVPAGFPWGVLLATPILLSAAIPAQLLNAGWLVLMPAYALCLLLAFLFFQNLRVRNERARLQLLSETVEHFACGVVMCEIDRSQQMKVVYISRGYGLIFEDEMERLKAQYETDRYAGVHPDDLERVRAAVQEHTQTLEDYELNYRCLTVRGSQKWINVKTEYVRRTDGTAASYATYSDLTGEHGARQQLSDLIQTVPCGICLYRWDGQRLHPLLANAQFSEMLGLDAVSHLESIDGFNYRLVHPEDVAALTQASMEALHKNHEIDFTFRVLNQKRGEYLWIRERGTLSPQPDGTLLAYVSYNDVTQEHTAERQLRESEQMLEYATQQAGLRYWRYNTETDALYPDERDQREYGLPPVLEQFSDEWLNDRMLHPDSITVYRDALERIKAGEKQVVFEAQRYTADQSLHWFRYCLSHLSGQNQNASVAVGTSMRIDMEKELSAKYELEKKRASMDAGNLIAHAVFNLSTGETLEYAYRDLTPVPPEDRTVFEFGRQNASLLIDDEERAAFVALNNADELLRRFALGETEFKLEYRRRQPGGEVTWVRSVMRLVRDPRGGDVFLFAYWFDIEEETMLRLMYRSIASDNYDYVARINLRTGRFISFPRAGLTHHMPPASSDNADEVTLRMFSESVMPEDREQAIKHTLIAGIRQNMRENGRFQFTYRELQPDGSIRHKKITQYYIDPQREIIAMMREDVTELIREETDKNRLLADALNAANQASVAKSQFLSRVSHELRTPLNAIIGFMELARDADAQQLAGYLSNADVAAKQLLCIINDVLDMSSIESGKMRIAHVPFDFKHLIHSITNLFVAQCQQKGLGFEARLATPVDEWFVGDRLRVNQILLNLLSNAVKFTSEGHVWLTVSQREGRGGKAFVRFEVADTGCGMSEDMQARLFKPFEQEDSTTAQAHGGNGLGLSIVGSLTQMMGGAIHAQSQLGVGTTFILDLPFARGESPTPIEAPKDLDTIHVLAVDDEAAEREYISAVLERIGVRHQCVEDGCAALAELERGWAMDDAYNICLVDWKMPNMNGIEIVRRIREKYGKDLIVIVVSAYEHYQADESAAAAGANLFISKPLFQSSLFDLFATLTNGRVEKTKSVVKEYDFTGKRVLLAEDNAMNRTIAAGLLTQRFGAACECAADGHSAVSMFLASAPEYYDAILMDIQMPVMNGYEATRAIRASEHPDANTVPIIALTANAFNEDIAKSLSSGMNAHVSKPIDPAALADALSKAFAQRERRNG